MTRNIFGAEKARPFTPRTPSTVKYGDGSIKLRVCFAASETDALQKVNGIMKEEDCLIANSLEKPKIISQNVWS